MSGLIHAIGSEAIVQSLAADLTLHRTTEGLTNECCDVPAQIITDRWTVEGQSEVRDYRMTAMPES